MKRKAFKIIGIILIACLVIIGWISIYRHIFCDPHFGTEEYFCVSKPFPTDISREQATKDIDFVMKKLRSRHPAWLEDYNKGVNLAEKHYAEVLNNLADDMTVFDVYKDLRYIIAPLGDGHTYINSNRDDVKMLDDTSHI